ncbi:hypothetical protein CEXT_298621 [Caerostris extrusa]|uniref:Maturase K n=1 Tax=Caerostris extrusa TaxID=172846 RepID=A0AAV4UTR8_CAEEX|nr:hypothetical protein CEXT_298621 [Caerostris extrusa]
MNVNVYHREYHGFHTILQKEYLDSCILQKKYHDFHYLSNWKGGGFISLAGKFGMTAHNDDYWSSHILSCALSPIEVLSVRQIYLAYPQHRQQSFLLDLLSYLNRDFSMLKPSTIYKIPLRPMITFMTRTLTSDMHSHL